MLPTSNNLLLSSLPATLCQSILKVAKSVNLPLRTMLEEQNERPEYATFLDGGMASVVVTLKEGGTAEVALIGREGFAGAYSLLGPAFPPTRCFMQVAGKGHQVPFGFIKTMFASSEEFRNATLRFVQQQAFTTAQLASCSQLHEVEPRLARWLLMVKDRVGGNEIRVTHEFLAQMLGVHRPTVTVALGILAKAGLIEINRGVGRIIDQAGLVEAACDCYPVTQELLEGLYAIGDTNRS